MSFENKSVEEILNEYSETPQKTTTPENTETSPVSSVSENSNIPEIKEPDPSTTNKSVDEILQDSKETGEAPSNEEQQAAGNLDAAAKGHENDPLSEDVVNSIQTLINSGKLKGFEDDKYETVSDLNQLIDANQDLWRDNISQEVNENFYSSKSPAWQTVMKYSEMVNSPQELIPFLEVMDDMEYSQNLDIENELDQEEIVRAASALKGLPYETIESDINDYKERGILKERSEIMKPALDQYNEARAQEMIAQQQQKESAQQELLQRHYSLIEENIINPQELGGFKLNDQDKGLVASTLIPDDSGSLPIFNMIDNLFSQGRFDILAKIALLGTNESSFNGYYSNNAEANMANNMQRQLRMSNEKDGFNTSETTQSPKNKPTNDNNLPYTLV